MVVVNIKSGKGYSRDFGAYIRIGLIGAAEHES